MKIKFLKDTDACEVMVDDGTDYVTDKLFLEGSELECRDVERISSRFSNIWLSDFLCLSEVRNDCFEQTE